MPLIKTETAGFMRDTSNMALINNNTRAYEIYKNQKKAQSNRQKEIAELKDEIEGLKKLLHSVINQSTTP